MKKLFIIFFLVGFSVSVQAQEKVLSLGADLINSRISSEYEVSRKSSARLDIDFTFGDYNIFVLNPEYHFHKINNQMDLGGSGILMPYHGPGVVIGLGESTNTFALEFVWGLEYDINDVPFEVFVDAGPYMQIEPSTVFSLSSSFGMRYKF